MKNLSVLLIFEFLLIFYREKECQAQPGTYNGQNPSCMSFNGQDPRKPEARNMTKSEYAGLVWDYQSVDGLAYYDKCPQEMFQQNLMPVSRSMQRKYREMFNHINTVAEPGSLYRKKGTLNTPMDIDDANAEKIFVGSKVTVESLDQPREMYTFLCTNINFGGGLGEANARALHPNEMFFVLTTSSGRKYVLASALCGNPVPIRYMTLYAGAPEAKNEEVFESYNNNQAPPKETNSLKRVVVPKPAGNGDVIVNNNITVYGAQATSYGAQATSYGAQATNENNGGGGSGELTVARPGRTVVYDQGDNTYYQGSNQSSNSQNLAGPMRGIAAGTIMSGIADVSREVRGWFMFGGQRMWGYGNGFACSNQGDFYCFNNNQWNQCAPPIGFNRPRGQGQDWGGVTATGGGYSRDWGGID